MRYLNINYNLGHAEVELFFSPLIKNIFRANLYKLYRWR